MPSKTTPVARPLRPRVGLVLRCVKPFPNRSTVRVGERLRLSERRAVPDAELWTGEWLDRPRYAGGLGVVAVSGEMLRSHFEEVRK